MGKRERAKAKSVLEEEDDSQSPSKRVIFIFSDSDDEEANEDLSLKIVEKAKSRAARAAENGGDTVAVQEWKVSGGEDVVTTELVASTPSVKKKVMKIKKLKKIKKTQPEAEVEPESAAKSEAIHVNVVGDEANVSTFKDEEVVNLSEGVENADNVVLRRLLRGPRYFDPPESNWGACFRCGEDGHSAANCLSAKRKKPCFICGSVEHEVKQCIKAKDCFICNESGHRAKDCPQKFKKCSKSSEFCLRCGASGHIMSSCNNEYSPDDLKAKDCFISKADANFYLNEFDTYERDWIDRDMRTSLARLMVATEASMRARNKAQDRIHDKNREVQLAKSQRDYEKWEAEKYKASFQRVQQELLIADEKVAQAKENLVRSQSEVDLLKISDEKHRRETSAAREEIERLRSENERLKKEMEEERQRATPVDLQAIKDVHLVDWIDEWHVSPEGREWIQMSGQGAQMQGYQMALRHLSSHIPPGLSRDDLWGGIPKFDGVEIDDAGNVTYAEQDEVETEVDPAEIERLMIAPDVAIDAAALAA